MDVNVFNRIEVPTLVPGSGLVDVSATANIVDWYVVRGDEPGEIEELTQMTLC